MQTEVLELFFANTAGFVLTGGAALVGFYAAPRDTTDLDLFTFDPVAFSMTVQAWPSLLKRHGLGLELTRTSPTFQRAVVTRGSDAVVVDVVHDESAQLGQPPLVVDGTAIDTMQQIFVNKITALVGREELRDVVDVRYLEQRGLRVEDNLKHALDKDGGCTPATLAWLLDSWSARVASATGARVPGSVASAEVVDFMRTLATRMRKVAFP